MHVLILKVDQAVSGILEAGDEVPGDRVAEVRLAQTRAYFLATLRFPDRYRKRLVELAHQLERDMPDTDRAFQASVMRFAGQYDLTQPLDGAGLQALVTQADGYGDSGRATAFISFISHQLFVNGRTASAKAVLDAGMDKFKGQAGWHNLFQQQFSQGHIIEPPPLAPGGVFQRNWCLEKRHLQYGYKQPESVYDTAKALRQQQAELNAELEESFREFIRDARESMAKEGVTHFEQSMNGGPTVVHVRDGQPVPLPPRHYPMPSKR
jgi:hypothetical protein